jgi:outer membrane protein assembly factor BamB
MRLWHRPPGTSMRPGTVGWEAVVWSAALWASVFAGASALLAPPATGTDDDDIEEGVSLPMDRTRERQLDHVRRLLTDSRWSDAAALCDEILAAPRDAFLREHGGGSTRRSLKAEVARLLREQPAAARQAYELLHGPRSASQLAAAIEADDEAAVEAVARRWFETPAGRAAAVIAAAIALENGQTAVASAWLDRLATSQLEDSLRTVVTAMRTASSPPADEVAGRGRSGDRDVDWRQLRGDPARNAVVAASRPLLVPRFRVPLVRHPAEARLFDRRRQLAAAQGVHLMPAGTPVATGGLVLVHTGWGLVAVDFASGKRVWMQPTGMAATEVQAGGDDDADPPGSLVFEDATAAGLAIAAGRVCAVETPPRAARAAAAGFGPQHGPLWASGNSLVAYDLARQGAVAWRLPRPDADAESAWYLGPPLAVGTDLYVLVEEKGEVRLDLIDAHDGTVTWSQPLAELEPDQGVTHPAASRRRRAGLSPALADGVLVCPLGVGTVIGIDVATRTLLWSHQYRSLADTAEIGGMGGGLRRLRAGGGSGEGSMRSRPRDGCPVIAGGRVLLSPYDADELVCLDLREGTPVWPDPFPGGVQLAGVIGQQVVVVGSQAVEAIDLGSGTPQWKLSWRQAGGHPSGRGIVTPGSLFLPLDSAEVIEVKLADGTLTARCPARGGLVPGNLITYRGEVISRGLDSLDVFHQVQPLEERIQTAARPDVAESLPAALAYWRGQLDLENGRIAPGLRAIRTAAETPGFRLPPGTVADAVIFGMQRDFEAAAPEWRAALAAEPTSPGTLTQQQRSVLRAAVDGFLRTGDAARGWEAIEEIVRSPDAVGSGLVDDPTDPALRVSPARWLRGRLAEVVARGSESLRSRVEDVASALVVAAAAESVPVLRLDRLETAADILGALPAADEARGLFIAACDRLSAERGEASDLPAVDHLAIRQQLQRSRLPRPRPVPMTAGDAAAWPLGQVIMRREQGQRDPLGDFGRTNLFAVPVEADPESAVHGLTITFDMQQRMLVVRDAHGRRVTEPLQIEQSSGRTGVAGLPSIEAAALGRLLFVRFGGAVLAYDLAGRSGQRLWTHAGGGSAQREVPFVWRHGAAGRPIGSGSVPLGMIITEPDDGGRTGFVRAGRAWPNGVLHHDGTTLALLDPARGTVLWERHRLPPATDLVGDESFVCVVAVDGRESLVLSMEDGRLLHACPMPSRRLRLGSSGRRIVSVRHPDGAAVAESGARRTVSPVVDLELFDPVTLEVQRLGSVPGESRAVLPGDGRLVLLEPDGQLTVFDLATATVAYRVRLPEMPVGARRLHVVPWEDRYLVIAGTDVAADGGHPADGHADGGAPGAIHALQVSALQQLLVASDMSPPLTGAVWAVDRSSGSLLWPAPATIDRHCLHTAQPAGLPVLLFCRLLHSSHDQESSRLSLLCLDRRTGHAVLAEDALPVQPHAVFGCEIEGDSGTHTVTVRELGAAARRIVLDFTGSPIPPQPPFRAARPGRSGAWGDFERLLEQLPAQIRLRRDSEP